jgi:hypothetical protein
MTKKIKLLTGRCGPGGSFAPGEIIEVDADEAVRMLASGQAEPVAAKKPRTASKRASKPAE